MLPIERFFEESMMKYWIFALFVLLAMPLMLVAGQGNRRVRDWVFTLLIFSTALGDRANINFFSIEQYRGPYRGIEINLTDVILVPMLWIMVTRHSKQLKWLPLNSVLMAGLFSVSIAASAYHGITIYSCFMLFSLVKIYLLYWVLSNGLRIGVDLNAYWRGFLAIGVYVTAVALAQKYLLDGYRVSGPFDHSNVLPSYANLIIPIMLVWSLGIRRMPVARSIVFLLAALGLTFSVFATFSRAGSALCTAGIILSLIYINMTAASKRVILTSIFGLVILVSGTVMMSDAIWDRFANAPEQSYETRKELLRATKEMIEENPQGVGANNFSYRLSESVRYQKWLTDMGGESAPIVHNVYYLVMAESGYLGLVFFMLIIIRFGLAAFLQARQGLTILHLLIGGYLIGMTLVMLNGVLEFALPIAPVLYLFAITSGFFASLADELKRVGRRPLPAAGVREPAL